ncbi:CDP-alcohol phosphatidyltransferase family protein [Nocardiopsis algeriensis]|uniref:CDP-diacylglycerol--serine O-phosphatidyltransferase n=1 Tax=Nocardiopsis algeriensis TaxID=1478215 RepID=A0A841ITP0_9ACTN|nr:CDP-alcohol phosphatidyltransferase family protein [Nocardiopsis algeriensis]MBB6119621.1 CDP-diacylglycerol--serine O-phosphatidyltransferase [Nocardiopsis algeriensis]
MTPTEQALSPALSPASSSSDDAPRLRLALADYLTLGNALCGFLAVWSLVAAKSAHAASGAAGPLPSSAVAAVVGLLLVAAALDLLDGRVARKLGGSGMGAELDNLADVISFGFAPAFLFVVWESQAGGAGRFAVLAGGAVLLAVIVRLARFSCQPPEASSFTGLPCPFGAMAVVTVVLIDPPAPVAIAVVLLISWLMVSRVSYPKPRGRKAYGVLTVLAAGVALVTAWGMGLPAGQAMVYAMSALVLGFVVVVPFLTAAGRRSGAGFPGD